MPARQVIVTADDFGLSIPVNEAVEIAHQRGILGGTSLMVGAVAAQDAVERARRLPKLRVGLHVVVVDGRPILPPAQVPDLVDSNGEFSRDLVRTGFRYFFIPKVRQQLAAEIRAQFEAFRATGLALDHVNTHKHLHLHPTVLNIILRVGRDYGLRAMRIPYEPARATRKIAGHQPWSAYAGNLLIQPWVKLLRHRIGRAGVCSNQFVFGLSTTGAMTEEKLLRIIECLPPGISEIYFHPATAVPCSHLTVEAHEEAELHALVSPRVRAAFETAGIQSLSFSELQ